jgi:outer membrane protein assembly factor BamB
MDPLAKELACACVKGYAQRDYRKLAARLEKDLKQRVDIDFSDDLAESLKSVNPNREIVVAGHQSLVRSGANKANWKCHPVCSLTGLDGATNLTASFVARSDDTVTALKNIGGRKVFLGVTEADDLHPAALALLRASGAAPAATPEDRPSYSDAALDLLDSKLSPAPLAVIPSYALPLLEGCGSIKPGSLIVIAKTPPVPFVTVFLADSIPPDKKEKILKTLLNLKSDTKLLKAMETRDGFKPIGTTDSSQPGPAAATWPDWRGPRRDAHVPRLPASLPVTPNIVWKKATMNGSLAGLSLDADHLILAERDFEDQHDVYRCLNPNTGELLWGIQFPAPGHLDYGQAPRATPVIHQDRAYLLGAFGGLRCVSLNHGKLLWKRDLPREFKAALPTWGMCSTPLLVDDLLVLNPGGTNASLVALDAHTGRTRWTVPGLPAAYSNFICSEFGGRRQIVGYDQRSLGGWDVKTGKRLWQLVPPVEGDFNVPTPVALDGSILLSTENNGTRLYRFDDSGRIIPKPVAAFPDLSPTTTSPVVSHGRVFATHSGLHCLALHDGLKPIWRNKTEALGDHATLIADDERVLVITLAGELLLLDASADHCAILGRMRLFEEDVEVYSHPALVANRLFARGGSTVVCVDLPLD